MIGSLSPIPPPKVAGMDRCHRACFCPEICWWIGGLSMEQLSVLELIQDAGWFEPEGILN
jgi:hypothetical protein